VTTPHAQITDYIYEPFAQTEDYQSVNSEIVQSWMELMLERGVKGIEHILDIATGVGTMVQLFLKHLPHHWNQPIIICLDQNQQALDQTQAQLAPFVGSLSLIHALAEEMDLPENSVDVAIWGNGIHYLDAAGQEKALRAITRSLKPGGWLFFNSAFHTESRPPDTIPFYRAKVRNAVTYLRSLGLKREERAIGAQGSIFLPTAHYEQLLDKVGFTIEEIREFGVRLYQTAWEHISGFQQYAAGALQGYDPETAADALRRGVGPAIREHGTKDRNNEFYVLRNWLAISARLKPMSS
jgi:ubiquinone/menaquinone biosynthesis C-methylase UbiE